MGACVGGGMGGVDATWMFACVVLSLFTVNSLEMTTCEDTVLDFFSVCEGGGETRRRYNQFLLPASVLELRNVNDQTLKHKSSYSETKSEGGVWGVPSPLHTSAQPICR